ncbi:MAG: helix-turn-helix domain-containing protein [Spirochaetia bacterium]|nr:helix-turn-helix domain-containing protein [Spirochaetia bacterium]
MKLHFCFSTDLPEEFHVSDHEHEALEIVYYLSGNGQTRLGKREFVFSQNHFTVIPAGTPHDERVKSSVRTVCLGLGESGLEKFSGCHRDADGDLRRILEKMLAESRERKPGFESILQGLAFQAAGLIERNAAGEKNARGKTEIVDKALAIIRETGGRVKVRELADDLFVSEDYLSHLIRSRTKHSPIRHIIATRMERAKTALRHSPKPLAEIAEACGFESVHYFSRLFKKTTGQTPAAFRNSKKVT